MDGHLTRSVPNRFSHYANPGSASHTLASLSVLPCPACISDDEQTVSIPLSHLLPFSLPLTLFFLFFASLSTSTRLFPSVFFFPLSARRLLRRSPGPAVDLRTDVIAISKYFLITVRSFRDREFPARKIVIWVVLGLYARGESRRAPLTAVP